MSKVEYNKNVSEKNYCSFIQILIKDPERTWKKNKTIVTLKIESSMKVQIGMKSYPLFEQWSPWKLKFIQEPFTQPGLYLEQARIKP